MNECTTDGRKQMSSRRQAAADFSGHKLNADVDADDSSDDQYDDQFCTNDSRNNNKCTTTTTMTTLLARFNRWENFCSLLE